MRGQGSAPVNHLNDSEREADNFMDVARLISLLSKLFNGVIVGAIPAVWGIKREQKILAIAGFFACLVAHFILGGLLSIPVCALFLCLIFKNSRSHKNNDDDTKSE